MQETTPAPIKIVIVEDNVSLAEIYKTRLELIGYECSIAYDGEEALKLIELQRPQLVLMDLMLPKLAGDEVLRRMRATDWGKEVRVYVISNLNETEGASDLRSLGIEGYAVKANLTYDDIDRLVDKILKPKDQQEDVSLDAPDTTVLSSNS